MFDIGAPELLVIAIVAILVIGPKDMPLALRAAGRWIGKIRRVSGHFKAGVESMIREAELEEMDKKWKEQNEAIMAAHPNEGPGEQMQPLDKKAGHSEVTAEARTEPEKAPDIALDDHTMGEAKPAEENSSEPGLPFGSTEKKR